MIRVRDMRKLFVVYACWALGLAASFAAAAVEVTGLYETEVPVTSQDAVERAAASRTALAEVLVKVSGSAEVAQRPELKPFLDQAEQWVQRYQYRAAPPGAGGTAAGTQAAPTQVLWMSFDRQTVNQRLSDAGLPVWGVNRPSILLWAAVEDGGKRYLVGGDNRPDLQGTVNAEARRRGLSLNLPLLDLQDQGSLAVADVWGDFSEMILKASDRYQPDAVLVGRVYAVAEDKWQSHWTLYDRGSVSSWESAEGAQDQAVAAGIDGTAEQFAKRYALALTPPGVGDSVQMTVENVATLADYARVTQYLQSLDPVAEVQVARVEGAKVSYRLKVRGQTQGLVQTIAWGKTLAPSQPESATTAVAQSAGEDKGAETSAGGEELRYRILP